MIGRIPGSEYTAPFLGQTAAIDAMKARLNDISALLSALEIGTLQQAPDGTWLACYWDEEQQRTQCERSAPPTPLQAEVLAMTPGERATLQQRLEAEAADLLRQVNEATQQFYYGGADPATTVVRVTSQQTPQGPVQVITTGPMTAPTMTPPVTTASGDVVPVDSDGVPVDSDGVPVLSPDDDVGVAAPSAAMPNGVGAGTLIGVGLALWLLFGRKRGR